MARWSKGFLNILPPMSGGWRFLVQKNFREFALFSISAHNGLFLPAVAPNSAGIKFPEWFAYLRNISLRNFLATHNFLERTANVGVGPERGNFFPFPTRHIFGPDNIFWPLFPQVALFGFAKKFFPGRAVTSQKASFG